MEEWAGLILLSLREARMLLGVLENILQSRLGVACFWFSTFRFLLVISSLL